MVRSFRYTHALSYLHAQQQYEDCLQAHDPNMLARMVQQHPFHVDALLSLSDIYQQVCCVRDREREERVGSHGRWEPPCLQNQVRAMPCYHLPSATSVRKVIRG
jgi:hypothetical protein